jgi:hypothetical protein
MIPVPGETAGEWWDNTGSIAARIAAAQRGGYSTDFDLTTYFLHDLSAETTRQGAAHERTEAEIVFGEPCRFEAWPDVPIHVIAGRDDRFVTVEELPGGHLLALSNPRGLADSSSATWEREPEFQENSPRESQAARRRSFDDGPCDGRRLAARKEPPRRGGSLRHADDRKGEVEHRHIA